MCGPLVGYYYKIVTTSRLRRESDFQSRLQISREILAAAYPRATLRFSFQFP